MSGGSLTLTDKVSDASAPRTGRTRLYAVGGVLRYINAAGKVVELSDSTLSWASLAAPEDGLRPLGDDTHRYSGVYGEIGDFDSLTVGGVAFAPGDYLPLSAGGGKALTGTLYGTGAQFSAGVVSKELVDGDNYRNSFVWSVSGNAQVGAEGKWGGVAKAVRIVQDGTSGRIEVVDGVTSSSLLIPNPGTTTSTLFTTAGGALTGTLAMDGGTVQSEEFIHIGPQNASTASAITNGRHYTGAVNAHGFSDATRFEPSISGKAFNSFDAKSETWGSQNLDHIVGFQSRVAHNGSGTLTDMWGLWIENIAASAVTNSYGVTIKSPTGVGAITNEYGLHIPTLNRGSTIWGAYIQGNDVYLGRDVEVKRQIKLTGSFGDAGLSFADNSSASGGVANIRGGRFQSDDPWFYLDLANAGASDCGYAFKTRASNANVTALQIEPAGDVTGIRIKLTKEGGDAILYTAGENLVKGEMVSFSASADDTVVKTGTTAFTPIGVVYASVSSGQPVWIVKSGRAQALLTDSTAAVRNYLCVTSTTQAGRITQIAAPTGGSFAGVDEHFRECGHSSQSVTAGTNVLAWVHLHFN